MRVTVKQQGQYHRGRVLLAAAAAPVEMTTVFVNSGYGLYDESSHVVFRNPLLNGWREKKRTHTVYCNQSSCHGRI